MESLSWYPRGMNMDGSISATCKGWVIFVLLPEECTNYVKMSTGFLTWLWVIPFKKIKIFQEYNFFFNDREEQKGKEKQSIPIEVIHEF